MSAFKLEKYGHLAVLTLNSAEKRNLLTPHSAMAIAETVQQLTEDPNIKALAVTGRDDSFCSGADLASLQQAALGDGEELQQIYSAFTSVAHSPLLTIALLNGPALGAGMNLAMACDIRLASDQAWFESRFFQLAIHPGGGHTWLLPQLVGWQQAATMIFCGERLSAQQALAAGFVKELWPEEQLLTRAKQLTAGLASIPTELVRQTKHSMLALRSCYRQDDAVAYEFRQQFQSLQQDVAQQHIAAKLAQISRKD
ncbi:MAG: enoyl-CoA hydratase/isomerase family protein [Gammaproteobacteria bacterium]|jgi:enoyl-CoA hydratase|nr:enoyl-CoA hydratase/isomerase family protein [Gammaproteobacteria bacterium]MBU2222422.1 enoyl-CoA hydratase/isomerase family protein [Gammaproteobacteria bacterium]MBU2280323.1 enoyl-CoA hydratase/isomerase family protein [Gammaproteobacteria bacterium]MBU2426500.1 enoyl-CoA hydratase/isomerase family protein [Gammaproteobacteria bacterium]